MWTETDVAVGGRRTGQRLVEGERDDCVGRESERGTFVVVVGGGFFRVGRRAGRRGGCGSVSPSSSSSLV